jgi:hypothetical protein
LIARDEEEADSLARDGALLENVDKARADRLEKLARELEALKIRKAREFDLLELRSRSDKRSSPILSRSHAGIRIPSPLVSATICSAAR